MKDTDLAYAAGIIDGEGSINGTSNATKRMVYIRVSVQQKGREVPDWLQERFGGKVYERPVRTNVLGASGGFVWQLDNRQSFRFLEQIRPFLVLKWRQADVALSFEGLMLGSGNRKSDELLAKQTAIAHQLSELNKGGAHALSSCGEI